MAADDTKMRQAVKAATLHSTMSDTNPVVGTAAGAGGSGGGSTTLLHAQQNPNKPQTTGGVGVPVPPAGQPPVVSPRASAVAGTTLIPPPPPPGSTNSVAGAGSGGSGGSGGSVVPAGMTNLGNTCYLNSLLQCLMGASHFMDKLRNEYYASVTNTTSGGAGSVNAPSASADAVASEKNVALGLLQLRDDPSKIDMFVANLQDRLKTVKLREQSDAGLFMQLYLLPLLAVDCNASAELVRVFQLDGKQLNLCSNNNSTAPCLSIPVALAKGTVLKGSVQIIAVPFDKEKKAFTVQEAVCRPIASMPCSQCKVCIRPLCALRLFLALICLWWYTVNTGR